VTDAVHAGPDGAVSPLDVGEVRLFLAGTSTLPSSAVKERCSVDGVTGACRVLDWALLARAQALGAPLAQVCRPAVCKVDPSDLDGDCLVGAADLCLGWATSAAAQTQDVNGDGVPNACQCGDLNGDGLVDQTDEARLGACVIGANVCDRSLADFDGNGVVDVADYAAFDAAREAGTLSALGCPRRLGPP
jgi:hypothetical protein